jgi:hypothetical protein
LLPDQYGNSNRYLKTDGANLSWGSLPNPAVETLPGSITQVSSTFSSPGYLTTGNTFSKTQYPELASVMDQNLNLNLEYFKQVRLDSCPQQVNPGLTTFNYMPPVLNGDNIILMQVSATSSTGALTNWNGIVSDDFGSTWGICIVYYTTSLRTWIGFIVIKKDTFLAWGKTTANVYKLFLSTNLYEWEEIDAASAGLILSAASEAKSFFAVTSDDIIFNVNSAGSRVYISTDFGRSWVAKNTSLSLSGKITAGAAKNVMLIMGTTVSRSYNSGDTWSDEVSNISPYTFISSTSNSMYSVMTVP